MNLVFMNRMEKKVEDRLHSGVVSIGEEQGVWHVVWEEPHLDGSPGPSFWYEGNRWDDMLVAFRMGVAQKKQEGYIPLIEDVAGGVSAPRGLRIQALQFYAEARRNEELFQELRRWRLEQSNREGKTPFILATNRTLEMISVYVPHSADELKQIPGMSAARAASYGTDILKLTLAREQPRPFPLDWVETEVDPLDLAAWQTTQQQARVRQAVQKQAAKRHILEGIAAGERMEQMEKSLSVPRRELIGWIEELDKEGYDVEPLIDAELSAVGGEERQTALQAMREEGARYLKPIFTRVYGKDKLPAGDVGAAYEWLRLLRIRFQHEAGNGSGGFAALEDAAEAAQADGEGEAVA